MATEQQLKNREIAAAGGTPPEPTDTTPAPSDFLTQIQQRLLDQSGIISSEDTNLETKIQEAISGIEKGKEAGIARIEGSFGREITDVRETGERAFTSSREAQRGFAVNNAALKQIQQDTEKSVRDLEQRKQELLLAGDATAAQQISALQLKELEFEQTSRQQSFSNMLSFLGFGLQQKTETRMESQFKQNLEFQKEQVEKTQKQSLLNAAAQAGVTVNPDDTTEDIRNNIASVAKERNDAELKRILSDIEKAKKDADVQVQLDESIEGFITDGESPDSAAALTFAFGEKIGLSLKPADLARFQVRAREIFNIKQLEKQLAELEAQQKMDDVAKQVTPTFSQPLTGTTIKEPKTDPLAGLNLSAIDFAAGQANLQKTTGDIFNNLFGE